MRARATWIFGMALAMAVLGSPHPSRATVDASNVAQALIAGLDLDDARGFLRAADGEDPRILLERARLAIYELDCDGAAAILSRREVAAIDTGESLGDIARGCQRVTAADVVDRDAARAIEVHWQDEHDRALAPLLFDTVALARTTLTRDLHVDWPRPTRILVVRDLESLSAVTGLPYESAQTTGTVAVAKWGRVTLLSPRASNHGYDWRDTLAHELTHLAVTRASGDRAPLWLQEGVAKREQVAWRPQGPFDDRPPNESVVQRGFEVKLGIPLDRLGPSIAMLPSADAATVAFAEVTSFVHYFVETTGPDALPKLLQAKKTGLSTDEALIGVSGAGLSVWDGRWRAYVASQRRAPLPELFELGGGAAEPRQLREARERGRLAELLAGRGHAAEALDELDQADLAKPPRPAGSQTAAALAADPSLRWLRGRLLEEAGRREQGAWLVADPADVATSFGPWWAMRGRWALLRGENRTAEDSLGAAVNEDPLGPESACGVIDASAPASLYSDPALCAAARAYRRPALDEE
jgi:hypothetical protein